MDKEEQRRRRSTKSGGGRGREESAAAKRREKSGGGFTSFQSIQVPFSASINKKPSAIFACCCPSLEGRISKIIIVYGKASVGAEEMIEEGGERGERREERWHQKNVEGKEELKGALFAVENSRRERSREAQHQSVYTRTWRKKERSSRELSGHLVLLRRRRR
jgi:hypothetical protein